MNSCTETISAAQTSAGARRPLFAEISLSNPVRIQELRRSLPLLIFIRAAIVLAGLNLADPLGLLPHRVGSILFLPFFNTLTALLMLAYLALWWGGRGLLLQLYAQIGVDLALATLLVAHTRGIESPFISFYILIIIYCSLMLGRGGGLAGAALSTILYAGMIMTNSLSLLLEGGPRLELQNAAFRISAHSLGFFAVAFLGTNLSLRLHAVQQELQEKISSLEQLQRLNENIVGSIRSGLITTDLQGKVAVFNSTAEELTERKRAEMFGKPVQILLGDRFWTQIVHNDFFQNARPMRHEEWVIPPSGARRYLGFSVSPLLNKEQMLLGYIISFQDLTEIQRLEEEVRLKDRMAAIGRMAAGLAHEIRNPLTSMRGSVEILRSRVRLPKPEERLLDILICESDRLNSFVEDFLLLARPGRHAKSPVELVSLLRDFASLFANSPEVREKHDIQLRLGARQIKVLGNADQLRQVFWNLAQNALRAMPDGGTLTVAAKRYPEGGLITFEDTGVGMSPEEQELLFQPFHSGFQGGTGLGLSIVFQIMEDHGGRISFESEKGKGTKVTLTLPAHSPVCDAAAFVCEPSRS